MKADETRSTGFIDRRTKVGGVVLCSVVVTLGAASEPIHASDARQPAASLGVTAIVVRPTIVSVERAGAGDGSVVVTSTQPAEVRVEGGSRRRLDRERTTVTAGESGAVITLSY